MSTVSGGLRIFTPKIIGLTEWARPAFIIQYFFIVIVRGPNGCDSVTSRIVSDAHCNIPPQAPVFFAAAVYLALKYAINLNEENLRISPVKQTFVKVFITIDTLTTILQIVGAALVSLSVLGAAMQCILKGCRSLC